MSHAENRDTICLEEAQILSQIAYPGDQYIVRLQAPGCALRASPGSFAHLTCDPTTPMRRPLSIMRANADQGWLEFLYKPVGRGLAQLANRTIGESVSVLGPIGRGFVPDPGRPVILAIGGGVGIPPIFFLAERLKDHPSVELLVLMGSEVPFPFELGKSSRVLDGIPGDVTATIASLEDWGIASRLASSAGYAGCYEGMVTDLARSWLATFPLRRLDEVQIVSCGPLPMLAATATLAEEYGLPCQVAVEEFMACGVGGCAGCTILVRTPAGPAMKRVCVDGPVFEAQDVFLLQQGRPVTQRSRTSSNRS